MRIRLRFAVFVAVLIAFLLFAKIRSHADWVPIAIVCEEIRLSWFSFGNYGSICFLCRTGWTDCLNNGCPSDILHFAIFPFGRHWRGLFQNNFKLVFRKDVCYGIYFIQIMFVHFLLLIKNLLRLWDLNRRLEIFLMSNIENETK